MRCWSHPTELGTAMPQDGTKMCFGVLTRTTPVSEMELGLSPEDGRHWEVSPACSCVPATLNGPTNPLGHHQTFIIMGGCTYVPGDVSNDLPFGQRGDAEAVVPMSAAEEQLPVGGHSQRAGAEVRAGREGALQEPLGPGGEGHGMVAEPWVSRCHLQ